MEPDLQQLQNRVAELEKWKAARTAQQITYPLDIQSISALGNYFMHTDALINYEVVGAASHVIFVYMASQGNQQFQIQPRTLFLYTVNTSTDTITTDAKYPDQTAVHVFCEATGAFPSPLAINTTYYVKNPTATGFQLSATPGGAAINFTTQGSGPQYIEADLL